MKKALTLGLVSTLFFACENTDDYLKKGDLKESLKDTVYVTQTTKDTVYINTPSSSGNSSGLNADLVVIPLKVKKTDTTVTYRFSTNASPREYRVFVGINFKDQEITDPKYVEHTFKKSLDTYTEGYTYYYVNAKAGNTKENRTYYSESIKVEIPKVLAPEANFSAQSGIITNTHFNVYFENKTKGKYKSLKWEILKYGSSNTVTKTNDFFTASFARGNVEETYGVTLEITSYGGNVYKELKNIKIPAK